MKTKQFEGALLRQGAPTSYGSIGAMLPSPLPVHARLVDPLEAAAKEGLFSHKATLALRGTCRSFFSSELRNIGLGRLAQYTSDFLSSWEPFCESAPKINSNTRASSLRQASLVAFVLLYLATAITVSCIATILAANLLADKRSGMRDDQPFAADLALSGLVVGGISITMFYLLFDFALTGIKRCSGISNNHLTTEENRLSFQPRNSSEIRNTMRPIVEKGKHYLECLNIPGDVPDEIEVQKKNVIDSFEMALESFKNKPASIFKDTEICLKMLVKFLDVCQNYSNDNSFLKLNRAHLDTLQVKHNQQRITDNAVSGWTSASLESAEQRTELALRQYWR